MTTLCLIAALITTPAVSGDGPTFTVRNVSFVVENKMPPVGAGNDTRRVELNDVWYDRHPDGKLSYCRECNRTRSGKYYIPPPGTPVTPAELAALREFCESIGVRLDAAPGVAAAGRPKCPCQSDPCPDGRCQAYGGSGLCQCRTVTTVAMPAATSPTPTPAPGSFGVSTPTGRTTMSVPLVVTGGGTSYPCVAGYG